MWTFSRAERVALAAAAVVLALQLLPAAGAVLEYRRALALEQPWRLLTAHFVHINWTHALVNCAAWWAVARLFAPDLSARRQALALLCGMFAVDAALLLLHPLLAWYRGLSGALHALYFCGATVWLARACPPARVSALIPLAMLAAGWVKVLIEQPSGALAPFAPWLGAPVAPQAHLAGAVGGAVLGLAFALFDARRARFSRDAVS